MKIKQALRSRWAWITAIIFLVQSYFKFQIINNALGIDLPFSDIYGLFIILYGFIFGLGLEKLFKG